MRRLLLLLPLLLATTARAGPVTGYALGTITTPTFLPATGNPRPYVFEAGEAVEITFTYDLDVPGPVPPAPIAFHLVTGSGFTLDLVMSSALVPLSRVLEAGDMLHLELAQAGTWFRLDLDGDTGTLGLERDLGSGADGFHASVTRTPAIATPEPGTFALGTLGALLLAPLLRKGNTLVTMLTQ